MGGQPSLGYDVNAARSKFQNAMVERNAGVPADRRKR